jgi:hypothetical protein
MEKEKKMRVATFRFGVISDFVGGAHLSRGEKEMLLGEKSERAWEIPFSDTVSKRHTAEPARRSSRPDRCPPGEPSKDPGKPLPGSPGDLREFPK